MVLSLREAKRGLHIAFLVKCIHIKLNTYEVLSKYLLNDSQCFAFWEGSAT